MEHSTSRKPGRTTPSASPEPAKKRAFRTQPLHRARLLTRMAPDAPARLTLVTAASGYGKTALLAAFARELQAKGSDVAWLDADDGHADPLRFLGALLASAQRARGNSDPDQPLVPEAALREAVAWIAADLARHTAPLLFVIDDYDRAQCEPLDAVLRDLLRECGPQIRFCIASQLQPRLKLLFDAADGDLLELTARDLRFTDAEIDALFGNELTAEETSRISVWTEGWPVAVQLVRQVLSMPHGRDMPLSEQMASGALGDHARRLVEQVLQHLPEDHRELLIETSFLDVLHVDLATAVTGRSDCWRILATLENSTVLLSAVALDPANGYRCHSLVREVLFRQLRSRGRQQLARRQRAAALWFRQEGELRAALRFALDAGDAELAGQLVLDAGGIFYGAQHGGVALRTLLERLPPASFAVEPRLRLAHSFLLAQQRRFDAVREILQRIAAQPQQDAMLKRDLAMAGIVLATYDGHRVDPAQLAALEEAADEHPADWLCGMVHNVRCIAQIRESRLDEASAACEAAEYYFEQTQSLSALGHMRVHGGVIAMEQASLQSAADLYRSGRDLFARTTHGDRSGCAIADLFLSEALYMQGRLDEAQALCAPSLELVLDTAVHYELLVAAYRTLSGLTALQEGLPAAIRLLQTAADRAEQQHLGFVADYLLLRRAELELLDDERTGRAFRAASLPPAREGRPFHWQESDLRQLLEGRLLLADGDAESALRLLQRQLATLQKEGRHRAALVLLLQLAVTHDATGAREDALAQLHQAVRIAARETMLQPFLEQGRALFLLLMALARPGQLPAEDVAEREFLDRVIGMLHAREAPGAAVLSGRELETVRLLANGKNNKLIARELGISPETVRFHLKSIYEKFGVSDRRIVVELAQQRGLLAGEREELSSQ